MNKLLRTERLLLTNSVTWENCTARRRGLFCGPRTPLATCLGRSLWGVVSVTTEWQTAIIATCHTLQSTAPPTLLLQGELENPCSWDSVTFLDDECSQRWVEAAHVQDAFMECFTGFEFSLLISCPPWSWDPPLSFLSGCTHCTPRSVCARSVWICFLWIHSMYNATACSSTPGSHRRDLSLGGWEWWSPTSTEMGLETLWAWDLVAAQRAATRERTRGDTRNEIFRSWVSYLWNLSPKNTFLASQNQTRPRVCDEAELSLWGPVAWESWTKSENPGFKRKRQRGGRRDRFVVALECLRLWGFQSTTLPVLRKAVVAVSCKPPKRTHGVTHGPGFPLSWKQHKHSLPAVCLPSISVSCWSQQTLCILMPFCGADLLGADTCSNS